MAAWRHREKTKEIRPACGATCFMLVCASLALYYLAKGGNLWRSALKPDSRPRRARASNLFSWRGATVIRSLRLAAAARASMPPSLSTALRRAPTGALFFSFFNESCRMRRHRQRSCHVSRGISDANAAMSRRGSCGETPTSGGSFKVWGK